MPKTLAQLKAECELFGIPHESLHGTEAHMNALRDYISHRDGTTATMLPQIDVMLAADLKDEFDPNSVPPWRGIRAMKFWLAKNIVAERKVDGARFKMHFSYYDGAPAVRLDSRRRSEVTYAFSEKSENFPHFTYITEFHPTPDDKLEAEYTEKLHKLGGTVLDGEIIHTAPSITTSGTTVTESLGRAMVVANSGPEEAHLIQSRYGGATYVAFDMLFWRGQDIRKRPYSERRNALRKVVSYLNHPNIEISEMYDNSDPEAYHKIPPGYAPAPEWPYVKRTGIPPTLWRFEKILEEGGEGVILKHVDGPYESGRRSKFWHKVKRFETQEGYVEGWRPGDHGFTGLVGALDISQITDKGSVGLCAVSAFPLELRRAMTAPDGSLKPEYYGRWVEVKFQQVNDKSGRGRHAQLVRWRDDIPRKV